MAGFRQLFQFRLTTLLLVTIVVSVALALLLQGSILRREFSDRLRSLRFDHAEAILETRREMVEDKYRSSSRISGVLRELGDNQHYDRQYLRTTIEWDFQFAEGSNLQSIESEIIECLRPILSLKSRWRHGQWNWNVEPSIEFMEEEKRGVVKVTVEYYRG